MGKPQAVRAESEVIPIKPNAGFRTHWQRAVLADPRLRNSEKLVAIAIAFRADSETLVCWPSTKVLATDSGLAQITVKKAVGILRDEGWLETRRRRNRSSLQFRLRIP